MQRTELLNQIILDICQCRLGSSIDALENLLLSNPKQSDMEKLVAIKNDYQQHVASNKNRVWIVIGDRKLTDMKALARFGRVVELKKEDVYR